MHTLSTVIIAKPFALDKTDGGMTLSGPKDCRGSTKLINKQEYWYTEYDARMRPTFLG